MVQIAGLIARRICAACVRAMPCRPASDSASSASAAGRIFTCRKACCPLVAVGQTMIGGET